VIAYNLTMPPLVFNLLNLSSLRTFIRRLHWLSPISRVLFLQAFCALHELLPMVPGLRPQACRAAQEQA
jgi:hypothetical protein